VVAVDGELETLTDDEVATAVAAIVAGELDPRWFATVALAPQQAVAVAHGVRALPGRDEVIEVGRIVGDDGRGPRFFDPSAPDSAPDIVLRRVVDRDVEEFELLTDLGYWDAEVGGVIVPGEQEVFRSDLTSVPSLFTWLVPRSGTHLPAALVHDGLVLSVDEPRSYVGPPISREQADRIFRDGMADLGTGFVRRWLVWAATALATMASDPDPQVRWRWRGAIGLTVAIVTVLGALAILDLFDCVDVLPWMGHRPVATELALGATGALVVPVLLAAVLWWGRQLVGSIFGISLAFLLPVTVALVAAYSVYVLAESVASRDPRRAALSIGALALVAGLPALVVWRLCG
jgi:hypothetical protein